jgi:hypothetical protein
MTYYIYDMNGYVGDFASIQGLVELEKEIGDKLPTLFDDGVDNPQTVLKNLEGINSTNADIQSTIDLLKELAGKCKGTLIITDGVGIEEDEDESLQHGGPGSGWTAEDGHVPGSQGGSGEESSSTEHGFSHEETLDAARSYKNYGYAVMNRIARGIPLETPDQGDDMLRKSAELNIKKMDQLIGRQPTSAIKVFRGDGAAISVDLFEKTGITKELGDNLETVEQLRSRKPPSGNSWDEYFTSKLAGVVIEDKGFISTSSSEKIVKERFLNAAFISKYGSPGLVTIHGKSKALKLKEFYPNDPEKEVILKRGTKMRIKSVKVGINELDGDRLFLQYDMEIVP